MKGNSKPIVSNQAGVHPDLRAIVSKHLQQDYQAPLHAFSKEVFNSLVPILDDHADHLILDAGCGTGESTVKLARLYPESFVIGIDKSDERLKRIESQSKRHSTGNFCIIRADLLDVWRQMMDYGCTLQHHFLLYPNPWPKKKHVMRRWHAHPVFPCLLALGGTIHLRTNWKVYAEEFQTALQVAGMHDGRVQAVEVQSSLTPFERKYVRSGHKIYEIRTCTDNDKDS